MAASTDVDGSLTGDLANGNVINMGTTAIDEATLTSQLGNHIGEGTTSVASGTATFSFALGSAATAGSVNIAAVQTIGGFEVVNGGTGEDYIVGDANNNTFNGNGGDDYINAGDGDDTITIDGTVEYASDVYVGGFGTDILSITATTILSTTDADITGFETITLGTGGVDVTLTGQSDGFTINGNTGANAIIGSSGVDTITGGAAADIMTGGAGADTFVYAAGVTDTVSAAASVAGIDQILDFVANGSTADLLDLTVTVATVNTAVAAGSADAATFITDINALVNAAGGVGFDTAVNLDISAALVTLNAGDQTGKTFLAVDLDGSDTFTATDFIIDVTGITATLFDTNVFV